MANLFEQFVSLCAQITREWYDTNENTSPIHQAFQRWLILPRLIMKNNHHIGNYEVMAPLPNFSSLLFHPFESLPEINRSQSPNSIGTIMLSESEQFFMKW